MNLPGFLTALERTSLVFWQDREPLTWVQAIALCTGQWGFYELAQFGYAGDGPRLGGRALLSMICLAVAFALIFFGPRLGPVSSFGPSLVRLISVALYLGSFMIFLNGLLPWVESLWPLPEYLGRYRGTACLVSGGVAIVLLTVRTSQTRERSAPVPWVPMLMSAVFLWFVTTLLLYWGIIPHVSV